MSETIIEGLNWLHDCEVLSICLTISANGDRQLALIVDCPQDHEFERWAGKRITLTAADVRLMVHTVWGMQTGLESIDDVRFRVSDGFRERLQFWEQKRAVPISEEYSIVFHSGSTLELMCREMTASVEDS